MRNTTVKLLITLIFLLIYINRGFFVSSAIEMEKNDNEINSVVEWLMVMVTGKNNNFDEDGDTQTDHNFVLIVQHDFTQQFAKILELANEFSINKNIYRIPNKEALPVNEFFSRIEQPPEV